MLPINDLQTLILELSKSNKYDEIVERIQLQLSDFNEFLFWEDTYYTRNCILRNKEYELIVLCWEPGQNTPIHCHNDQECWVYVVSGSLFEEKYKIDENETPNQISSLLLNEAESHHINDAIGFHRLYNNSKERTVSLHLYAKPIDECSYFSEDSETFKVKKLSYNNFKEVI